MIETNRNITAFEARTRLGEMLDYVRYAKKPCIIERHGKPVAALVDIETFQKEALEKQYRQWVDRAVEQIKTNYQPEKIILFGSVASGLLEEGSDIDFFIIKDTPKRKLDRIDEANNFLDPDIPVEFHIYTPKEIEERLRLGDFFVKEILEKGKVLYERKENTG